MTDRAEGKDGCISEKAEGTMWHGVTPLDDLYDIDAISMHGSLYVLIPPA